MTVENDNVSQKFPLSWFSGYAATRIWEKERRDTSSLVSCIGIHQQSRFEGYSLGQDMPWSFSPLATWMEDWDLTQKSYTNHRAIRDLVHYISRLLRPDTQGSYCWDLPPMQNRIEQIRKLVPCKPDTMMHHASQGTKRTQASWKRPQRQAESHKMIGQSSKATMGRQWVLVAKWLKSRLHMGHYDLLMICADLRTLCTQCIPVNIRMDSENPAKERTLFRHINIFSWESGWI